MAKRAVWLGNDETHYVRIWTEHDVKSLKMLIDLTIHWIDADALSDQFELIMPAPGK